MTTSSNRGTELRIEYGGPPMDPEVLSRRAREWVANQPKGTTTVEVDFSQMLWLRRELAGYRGDGIISSRPVQQQVTRRVAHS